MAQFAANLSMMFTEHPFIDRFSKAAKAGFRAVEFLFPYDFRAKEIRQALDDAKLKQVLFNTPPGDWESGERGMACIPGREQEFKESVHKAIEYASALSCPRLHCMAGLMPDNVPIEVVDETYKQNLQWAVQQAEGSNVRILMEPINPIDIPGFYLNDFDQAIKILNGFEATVTPRLQFDIYHCARIHGEVAQRIHATAAWIEHFQIAGPKQRHEPDDGALALEPIMAAVDHVAPACWVGCEYHPAGRTEDGLDWMRPFVSQ